MNFLRWIPAVVWVFIICLLSFSALDELPLPTFFSADKIAHFGMYAILEYFLFFGLKNRLQGLKGWSIAAILFSGFTELIQHFFIHNRYGEWLDFLANVVGLLVMYIYLIKTKKT